MGLIKWFQSLFSDTDKQISKPLPDIKSKRKIIIRKDKIKGVYNYNNITYYNHDNYIIDSLGTIINDTFLIESILVSENIIDKYVFDTQSDEIIPEIEPQIQPEVPSYEETPQIYNDTEPDTNYDGDDENNNEDDRDE